MTAVLIPFHPRDAYFRYVVYQTADEEHVFDDGVSSVVILFVFFRLVVIRWNMPSKRLSWVVPL